MIRTRRFTNTLRWLALSAAASSAAFALTGCNGCNSNASQAPIISNNAQDPATANLAYAPQGYAYGPAQTSNGKPVRVLGQSASYSPQENGQAYYPPDAQYQGQYQQQPAYPQGDDSYNDPNAYADTYDPGYDEGQPVAQETDVYTDQATGWPSS